jgi:hypothetical protein
VASRAIKKELLKAFPMFYFRVRRHGEVHRIDVVKGPVDFKSKAKRKYVRVENGDGTFTVSQKIMAVMGIPNEEAHLLTLMAKHVLYELPLYDIDIALGTYGNEYEVTYETDSTILIDNRDGSKSYRGYDFKRFRGTGRWQLYYDDMPVLYNNELAENSRQVGTNISFTSISNMKAFIDKICGDAFDERAAVAAKMVTARHLFSAATALSESWVYRGHTIELDSAGWYQIYDIGGVLAVSTKSLPSALTAIDKHLKTS